MKNYRHYVFPTKEMNQKLQSIDESGEEIVGTYFVQFSGDIGIITASDVPVKSVESKSTWNKICGLFGSE